MRPAKSVPSPEIASKALFLVWHTPCIQTIEDIELVQIESASESPAVQVWQFRLVMQNSFIQSALCVYFVRFASGHRQGFEEGQGWPSSTSATRGFYFILLYCNPLLSSPTAPFLARSSSMASVPLMQRAQCPGREWIDCSSGTTHLGSQSKLDADPHLTGKARHRHGRPGCGTNHRPRDLLGS